MSENGSDAFFEHHGVKGMHWGVRRKVSGPASEESATATAHRVKGKTEGVHTLTNKELETFIRRANLEQSFARLTPTRTQKTINFITGMLTNVGKEQVKSVVSNTATKSVKTALDR